MSITQEEKRVLLAEAEGWKGVLPHYMIGYAPWRPVPYEEKVKTTSADELWSISFDVLPDYFNDLNAIHSAEQKTWSKDYGLRAVFVDHLARILNPIHGHRMQSAEDLLDASAAQRAEALGKTLNLW